ncbi:probable pectinesterase/pectinesterase inhibitor 58 [Coffea eugenioides]|uniref:probable pectinesterase/pectinesterase inhibitor 58 n=1 Tax=Coffea eugenioides TaxID=49369 RepID=UPI000F60A461|nr:probable pectinesterase/pectinesterase inhibitor 58 [Coffea eugenioides]
MHQALALHVTANESIFHNYQLDGHQNTLYAYNHRQFYCNVPSVLPLILALGILEQSSKIAPQGRFEELQTSAIILQNCKIIPDTGYPTQDPSYRASQGRPWNLFSRTIIMDPDIDTIIHTDGWARWLDDQNTGTCWYAEIENKGAGTNQTKRVTWPSIKKITEKDAVQFIAEQFFGRS